MLNTVNEKNKNTVNGILEGLLFSNRRGIWVPGTVLCFKCSMSRLSAWLKVTVAVFILSL